MIQYILISKVDIILASLLLGSMQIIITAEHMRKNINMMVLKRLTN